MRSCTNSRMSIAARAGWSFSKPPISSAPPISSRALSSSRASEVRKSWAERNSEDNSASRSRSPGAYSRSSIGRSSLRTRLRSGVFEIGRIGAEAIGALDDEFQSEPETNLANEALVAIRFRPAQAMVQMRRGEPKPETMSDRAQRVRERDRIGAAGKTEQNEFVLS